MKTTYHSYFAECSKELYEEYGQIIGELAMRYIQNMGVHFQEAFRGDNGNPYHYGILVMAANPLAEELAEFFPKITTRWSHREEELAQEGTTPSPFTMSEQQDGKLLLKATKQKVSFRI